MQSSINNLQVKVNAIFNVIVFVVFMFGHNKIQYALQFDVIDLLRVESDTNRELDNQNSFFSPKKRIGLDQYWLWLFFSLF